MRKLVLSLISFLLVILTGIIGGKFTPEKAVATQQADTANSGTIVAALPDFDLKRHGFSFKNYGDTESNLQLPLYIKNPPTPTNLTSEDMRRMFGAQVCASEINGECTLTPPAEEWMEKRNESMNGGHCEGMAALSLMLYAGIKNPSDFGSAQNAYGLNIAGNKKLQREIAYWFVTQNTTPTTEELFKDTAENVVNKLKESFQEVENIAKDGQGSVKQLYTLGVYRKSGTGAHAGHAITPYAVKDLGNGKSEILVYDNNHPEKPQSVRVNTKENTWEYGIWQDDKYSVKLPDGTEATVPLSKSKDDELYIGDADNQLELTNTPKRLTTPQVCSFCADQTSALKTTGQKDNQIKYNEIWMEGEGSLLITDAQGRRFGYVNNKLVEEIPGVTMQNIKSADLSDDITPQIYYIPLGIQFSLAVDGSNVKNETETAITMFGPGYDLGIEEIKLDPGQKDTLTLSPDGQTLTYKTNGNESPTIDIGFESAGPDYGFSLKGVDLDGGGVINVNLDKTKGVLSFDTKQNQKPGTYALLMERINDQGEQTFYHDNIRLNPNDTASLDYKKWSGEGGVLQLKIDRGSQGSTIDTIELTDDEEKA